MGGGRQVHGEESASADGALADDTAVKVVQSAEVFLWQLAEELPAGNELEPRSKSQRTRPK